MLPPPNEIDQKYGLPHEVVEMLRADMTVNEAVMHHLRRQHFQIPQALSDDSSLHEVAHLFRAFFGSSDYQNSDESELYADAIESILKIAKKTKNNSESGSQKFPDKKLFMHIFSGHHENLSFYGEVNDFDQAATEHFYDTIGSALQKCCDFIIASASNAGPPLGSIPIREIAAEIKGIRMPPIELPQYTLPPEVVDMLRNDMTLMEGVHHSLSLRGENFTIAGITDERVRKSYFIHDLCHQMRGFCGYPNFLEDQISEHYANFSQRLMEEAEMNPQFSYPSQDRFLRNLEQYFALSAFMRTDLEHPSDEELMAFGRKLYKPLQKCCEIIHAASFKGGPRLEDARVRSIVGMIDVIILPPIAETKNWGNRVAGRGDSTARKL